MCTLGSWRAGVLLLALGSGCSSSSSPDLAETAPPVDPLVAARPYGLTLPAGLDKGKTYPLVLVLHGYGANGAAQDAYFGLSALADARQLVVAAPDGTVDSFGKNFWNATDACCDFDGTKVDDVAYLTAVIHDTILRHHVDPRRVFVVGHSNGAFMAHRMACDRAELIAGIAALAGETWSDPTRCMPSAKLAVAQIHGDMDSVVHYDGGQLSQSTPYPGMYPYPSTPSTFAFWQKQGACTGETDAPALDLVDATAGAETLVRRSTGCVAGSASELWKIQGADHLPLFNASFAKAVYDFFEAHPRP